MAINPDQISMVAADNRTRAKQDSIRRRLVTLAFSAPYKYSYWPGVKCGGALHGCHVPMLQH